MALVIGRAKLFIPMQSRNVARICITSFHRFLSRVSDHPLRGTVIRVQIGHRANKDEEALSHEGPVDDRQGIRSWQGLFAWFIAPGPFGRRWRGGVQIDHCESGCSGTGEPVERVRRGFTPGYTSTAVAISPDFSKNGNSCDPWNGLR